MHIAWLHQPNNFTTEKLQLLNKLAEQKLPVPQGFVITPEAYQAFLQHNTIDLND